MTKHVPLSPQAHGSLRLKSDRSEDLGDAVMAALTVPQEFRSLQNHYPIVFQRTPERDQFRALALFGFENGENLFLTNEGWDARVIPLSIEVQPLLVGLPREDGGQTQIHIDLNSPRVSKEIGERLFDEQHIATDYLNSLSGKLSALHEGFKMSDGFIAALQEHDLLEPFTVDVELDDGSKNRLVGFHTVNEEKLRNLSGDAIARLHNAGHLMPIFMVVASLSNLTELIARKNAGVSGRATSASVNG